MLDQALIRSLLYFDLFSYPLTEKELMERCDLPNVTPSAVKKSLDNLSEEGYIFHIDGFYLARNDKALVQRRLKGNELARKRMRTAYRFSRFIQGFPFVKSVMLSGSISKDFMEEGGDIDYFIVTKPGRLWLARTMLIGFKKIFLLNSYKNFCVNYFIDTDHLEIEEKNQFTATELVTLIPMTGTEWYQPFLRANPWAESYMPNFPDRPITDQTVGKRGPLKKMLEGIFNTRAGEKLDGYFMKITVNHWNKKFHQMDKKDLDVALKSRKYVSKHHPSHFQQKVILSWQSSIRKFEEQNGVSLSA